MKTNIVLISLVLTSVLFCSCGDDPVNPVNPDNSVTRADNPTDTIITTWGMPSDSIILLMSNYTMQPNAGADILQFATADGNGISYQLYDGRLCATAVVYTQDIAETDIQSLFDGYTFLGELNGGKIYENSKKNTVAAVWQIVEGNRNYSAIGFAPITSDAYEQVAPITVTTYDNAAVEMFKATVSGKVEGVSGNVEAGIIYGATPNLSEYFDKKESTMAHGEFSVTLTGLIDESTLYYRAYAIVDGFCYLGEIQSFQPMAITYSIDGIEYKMIRVESPTIPTFYIMQTELPNESNLQIGSYNFGMLNKYVDFGVTLSESYEFLKEVRAQTGIPFRFPTVEEWQYAASGGNKSCGYTYSGSNSIDEVAWYRGNSNNAVHDVATKKANELGIYDMCGNYAELTSEVEGDYYYKVDGKVCGGSWKNNASNCTITSIKSGIVTGHITGTNIDEKNAYDARYIAVRLVYSVPETN